MPRYGLIGLAEGMDQAPADDATTDGNLKRWLNETRQAYGLERIVPAPVLIGHNAQGGETWASEGSDVNSYPVADRHLATTPLPPLPAEPRAAQAPAGQTQFSLGVSGTVFVPLTPLGLPAIGLGGGGSLGVTTDGTLRNTSLYLQGQGNAMVGAGAYAGWGVTPGIGRSAGPLQSGSSTSGYYEADAGYGLAGGISGTLDDASGLSGANLGIPHPRVKGVGYGGGFGVGVTRGHTWVSPSLGEAIDWLKQGHK